METADSGALSTPEEKTISDTAHVARRFQKPCASVCRFNRDAAQTNSSLRCYSSYVGAEKIQIINWRQQAGSHMYNEMLVWGGELKDECISAKMSSLKRQTSAAVCNLCPHGAGGIACACHSGSAGVFLRGSCHPPLPPHQNGTHASLRVYLTVGIFMDANRAEVYLFISC